MQLSENPSSPGPFPHQEGGRGVSTLRVWKSPSPLLVGEGLGVRDSDLRKVSE